MHVIVHAAQEERLEVILPCNAAEAGPKYHSVFIRRRCATHDNSDAFNRGLKPNGYYQSIATR